MTLKSTGYIITICLITLLALFSSASVVMLTKPEQASTLTLTIFYISVFLSTAGLATLVGLGIRFKVLKERFMSSAFVSIRQGLLVGILLVSSLLLQSQDLLYWWVEASIILLLIVVEILFNL